jgi:hypothetical protein
MLSSDVASRGRAQLMIALLRAPGSRWMEQVAADTKREVRVLELDAALAGHAVTVTPKSALWQGAELTRMHAVVVERPWFAWPQATLAAAPSASTARRASEREARALSLSALHVAAQHARVMQPLGAAALATAPLTALDLCAAAGLDVRPWRMTAARPASPAAAWLDLVGADAWTAPRTPAVGEPAWSPEPFDGAVLSLLVVGDELVGARRYADAQAWQDARSDGLATQARENTRETAQLARRALGVDWLQVELLESAERAQVLAAYVGPDLAAWDRDLRGAVASAFSKLLSKEAVHR